MQKIYSQAIIELIAFAKSLAKQILSQEMGIQVMTNRFSIEGLSYPLNIAIFENHSAYGYFDPNFYEIGLNKCFVYHKGELIDTLRHELGHYVCWIRYNDTSHGKAFKDLCKSYGWKQNISKSRVVISEPKEEKIASKIEKLLALSNSRNQHEAQAALIKANALLFQHKIAGPSVDFATRQVLSASRSSPKWVAIGKILSTFGVHVVHVRSTRASHLEVFGPKINVSTADYVAAYLDRELDRLFSLEKHLHGLIDRHCFYDGIAKGYLDKRLQPKQEKALIKVLENNLWMAYPNLQQKVSRRRYSKAGTEAGFKAGAHLSIRSPVESNASGGFLT